MIVANEKFKQPKATSRLWRYIPFAKFLNLIHRKELHFATVNELRGMDKHEGIGTTAMAALNLLSLRTIADPTSAKMDSQLNQIEKEYREIQSHFIFVNSWAAMQSESMALWSIYCRDYESVAISTSYQRLSSSLNNEGFDVGGGMVNYKAYDFTERSCHIAPALTKIHGYEYESEYRLYVDCWKGDVPNSAKRVRKVAPRYTFLKVPVNLSVLMEKVVIHPDAPAWFKDDVKELLKKFGLPPSSVRNSEFSF